MAWERLHVVSGGTPRGQALSRTTSRWGAVRLRGGRSGSARLVQVQSSFGVRYAQVMASVILTGLPLVAAFMLFQRQMIRGVATTGLGGT
jgi:hypothetical protein